MLGHLTGESIQELHDIACYAFAERGAEPNVRHDLDSLRELRFVIIPWAPGE